MMNFLHSILITLLLTFSLPVIAADEQNPIPREQIQIQEEDQAPVKIEILTESDSIQKGSSFSLILRFDIEQNWHTYWKNPGDSGMPARVEWKLPDGIKVNAIHWQAPDRFTLDDTVAFGYEKEMVLLVDMESSSELSAENDKIDISASIDWLACSDQTCLPGSSEVTTTLLVKNEKQTPKLEKHFKETRENLPKNDWELAVHSENSKEVKLMIKPPKDHTTNYSGGYFCEEEIALVDHKNLTSFENSSGTYEITLNRLNTPAKQNLKGIFVFVHDQGKESINIDLPIQTLPSNESEEIAFVDPSEIKAKLGVSETIHEDETTTPDSEFEGGFMMALLFAFIGGMLLNLMPCVLPVLSLKIFSFVKMSGESRSLCLKHGLSFSLGVLLSFWALAAVLLILQASGNAVGWGFQLQEPIFVAILASIVFLLGLNLFGIMEIGTSITSLAGNIKTNKEGLSSSFFSGILATAIATPCTGPFLGSAVGYAVTLPSILALLIFTMLGAGMAFPYLLLSAYPSLLRFIPKPGNWMITFKEIMGFFMMATTIWLLWVFSAETSNLSMIILIIALLLFGVSAWIYGKWGSPIMKKLNRRIAYAFSIGFFALGAFTIFVATTIQTPDSLNKTEELATTWEPFSPARIKELQAQGIPVFVDFTAKWCLICQTNHMSLTTDNSENAFNAKNVVRMKADWTKNDPVITAELKKFGRNSVPLYVLYGTNPLEKPKVLPQVLTSDIVTGYLKELNSK